MVKKVISPETVPQVSLPVAKVASVVLNEVVAGVLVVAATTTEVDESASSVVVKVILPEIAHLLVVAVPVLLRAGMVVAKAGTVVALLEARPVTTAAVPVIWQGTATKVEA